MKNLILTFVSICIGLVAAKSTANDLGYYASYDGTKVIFVEGGIEFSIFPDGHFDFVYLGHPNSQVSISTPNVAVNFNSGYNYDAYVQYDSYGAVIQIEDTPIYYDHYGRIVRAGDVTIRYNNRRLVQVGGMYYHYNPHGYFSHYTGYINVYNRYYVYRPWHVYYTIPYYTYHVVYTYPYRRYYTPVRYSYGHHKKHFRNGYAYANGRREFYRPGSRLHHSDGRASINRDFSPTGRSGELASATYRRDDQVIRTNFISRTETAQRGNTESSTALRTEGAQRGTPQESTVSRNEYAQRGTSATNNVMRNDRVERVTSKGNTLTRTGNVQRENSSLNNTVRNESTQRPVPTTQSQNTQVNRQAARPVETQSHNAQVDRQAARPTAFQAQNTQVNRQTTRPAATQAQNTQANRATVRQQNNTPSRTSAGNTSRNGGRG